MSDTNSCHSGSEKLYIGIMSGTSLDGIDTVAVSFSSGKANVVASGEYPFPADLRDKLMSLALNEAVTVSKIGELDHRLGHLYADATLALLDNNGIPASQIAAIGCHGQTVFHQPTGPYPFTMQIGDANIIAARTGITTVADFRRKDMAFGGQGAPLVPAFHRYLFEQDNQPTVVLNIGGIANISIIEPGKPVLGYDTGPGNMLMDAWIQRHQNKTYDADGLWASSGQVDQTLLHTLLQDAYFSQPAPKSTGRELFNLDWLDSQLKGLSLAPESVQATLLALTVASITNELEQYPPGRLLVCGGGARNPALLAGLSQALPAWSTMTTDDVGVSADFMEAIAFAWLAYRNVTDQPGNAPEVTGATQACRLGAVYSPN